MLRYALTIFVSAFLLFQVQPLIGRYILPWFGGGPSIWTSCMLFFQIVLLGGYLYSHLLSSRLSRRAQVGTHLCLLALSVLFLPIAPSESWKPIGDQSPMLQILLLLLATVGGPYFMLASTGPLMQRWFSQTSPGRSPYRLYALSNVGSLLALISYPLVFEPWLKLRHQVFSWSLVYAVYVGLAVWCAIRLLRHSIPDPLADTTVTVSEQTNQPGVAVAAPGGGRMLLWLALAACGSTMLLATTNQLCIDVATVPFLWVLPLGLYLLSFIICFDSPHWYDRRVFGLLLLGCCPMACYALYEGPSMEIADQVALFSVVLFTCCMICHGELVRTRPDPKHLTLFYLLVSAGGALGGAFVAVAAPQLFSGYYEYHAGLFATCVVALTAWYVQRVWRQSQSSTFWLWALATSVQVLAVTAWYLVPTSGSLKEIDRTVYFGIYLLIQTAGLALTAAFEKRTRTVATVWTVTSLTQCAWLIGYARWRFPGDMLHAEQVDAAAGVFLPAIVAVGLLYVTHKLQETFRSYVLQCAQFGIVVLWVSALWYSETVASWQASAFCVSICTALALEFAVQYFRGPQQRSLGFWLWLPSIALISLLGHRLQEIVAEEDVDVVHTSRNFYGVLRVTADEEDDSDEYGMPGRISLLHGQIRHGFQYLDVYWKTQPTTYYGQESGIGIAIELCRKLAEDLDQHALRVGVVGLGTGTIAAYGQSDEYFRFYDINSHVRDLSAMYFTYLSDSDAETEVVIGDARIVMECELATGQSQQFDVLAIDAFSSDAIPVHLLTTECAEIYREQLRPGGVLAIHISNRFLELDPVTRGMAEHLGWHAVRIENDDDDSTGVFTSTWVLLSSSDKFANSPAIQEADSEWDETDRVVRWTDDYSGLWQILSF
ncbi:MAG: spermidine synthase [Fuerstiella sp.]|nr:spermidine synthase [Fuerstiella sp.]